MTSTKRILIATLSGLLFGFVCMGLAASNPDSQITNMVKASIVIGRMFLGFTIGISALRMKWAMHGIVLGAVTSIPMAVPILDNMTIAISTVVMGMIYGLLTELITSKLFKAPQG